MDATGLFKNLSLDYWFKAFVYVGGILFLVSLFVEVKGINNVQLQLLSGGLFFVGIGEWKNLKTVSWIKENNFFTGPAALVSTDVRRADFVGVAFDLIGLGLIAAGAVNIIWSLFTQDAGA